MQEVSKIQHPNSDQDCLPKLRKQTKIRPKGTFSLGVSGERWYFLKSLCVCREVPFYTGGGVQV